MTSTTRFVHKMLVTKFCVDVIIGSSIIYMYVRLESFCLSRQKSKHRTHLGESQLSLIKKYYYFRPSYSIEA